MADDANLGKFRSFRSLFHPKLPLFLYISPLYIQRGRLHPNNLSSNLIQTNYHSDRPNGGVHDNNHTSNDIEMPTLEEGETPDIPRDKNREKGDREEKDLRNQRDKERSSRDK